MESVNVELSYEEIKIILQAINNVNVKGIPLMEKMIELGNKLSKAVKNNGNSRG